MNASCLTMLCLFHDKVVLFHGWFQAEADRIANEIEKNKSKESRELEQERMKKMVRLLFFMLELHSLDLGVWF